MFNIAFSVKCSKFTLFSTIEPYLVVAQCKNQRCNDKNHAIELRKTCLSFNTLVISLAMSALYLYN